MALINELNAKEVLIYLSLNDPIIFSAFNADRIEQVIKSMGHQEHEPIEHKMISKSIERAQKKLMIGDLPSDCAESLKKWMESLG